MSKYSQSIDPKSLIVPSKARKALELAAAAAIGAAIGLMMGFGF